MGNEGVLSGKTGREEAGVWGLVWDSSSAIVTLPYYGLKKYMLEWQSDRVRRSKTEKGSAGRFSGSLVIIIGEMVRRQ